MKARIECYINEEDESPIIKESKEGNLQKLVDELHGFYSRIDVILGEYTVCLRRPIGN